MTDGAMVSAPAAAEAATLLSPPPLQPHPASPPNLPLPRAGAFDSGAGAAAVITPPTNAATPAGLVAALALHCTGGGRPPSPDDLEHHHHGHHRLAALGAPWRPARPPPPSDGIHEDGDGSAVRSLDLENICF